MIDVKRAIYLDHAACQAVLIIEQVMVDLNGFAHLAPCCQASAEARRTQ